jgi:uncharacterized membrane protein YfcA
LSIETILILFALGAAAGILAGMFGVGGGIIIVPSLIWVYSYLDINSPYIVHIAIATSLFTIIFTSISSTYKHSRHGNVITMAAVIIGLASSVTVFLFSLIAIMLPGETLAKFFSVIILAIGLKLLFDRKKEEDLSPEHGKNFNRIYCMLIGFITGIISAFSGLGGGGFAIPLMHYMLKYNIKKAIGTSTLAVMITAIAGVVSYIINKPADVQFSHYTLGMVDVLSALPIIAGSIPFAQLGVWINKKTDHYILTKLFALFILIIAVKMLFF